MPDLRESTLKGVGLTSKSDRHYNLVGLSLGEFINDSFQKHGHSIDDNGHSHATDSGSSLPYPNPCGLKKKNVGVGWVATIQAANYLTLTENVTTGISVKDPNSGNFGVTTESKAVGVNWIIKAM